MIFERFFCTITALPVFSCILDVSQYYCGADKNSALYSNRTPRSKWDETGASQADKAIVRMETKIEYIIKGIDEIKAEVKN